MLPNQEAPIDATHAGATRNTTVLLAEDQPRVRKAIAKTLRRHHYTVIEAKDGREAIALARSSPPDMVVIDLDLPEVDGYSVIRRLKDELGASLPCLVVSGEFESARRKKAFDVGADDFMEKPVDMHELVKRVDAFRRKLTAYTTEQKARRRAERLNLYAAEASALIAHDLNNGLAAAIGNLQYVEEVVTLSGEPAAALAASHRAMRRMAGLVKNFVDISRLEEDALIPKRKVANVRQILQTAAEIHEAALHATSAHISVECDAELEWNIDDALIERVIHNLVGNATRYVMKGGSIMLGASVVPSDDGEPALCLRIENDGPPVPERFAKVIFEKYRAGTDGEAMRGMGLYFCRLACEAHGGSITLSSTPRRRTAFVIVIPREG